MMKNETNDCGVLHFSIYFRHFSVRGRLLSHRTFHFYFFGRSRSTYLSKSKNLRPLGDMLLWEQLSAFAFARSTTQFCLCRRSFCTCYSNDDGTRFDGVMSRSR